MREHDLRILSSGAPTEFVETLPGPDGQLRSVLSFKFPLKEASGRVLLGGMAVDITERLRMEEELRKSEERMRLANEASGVGIWEWNVKANVLRWDQQMFRIYGIEPTPDGLIDYSIWSRTVHPDELAQQEALLHDTVRNAGRGTREFRIRRADGQVRFISAGEVYVKTGTDAEWVVGTNLDITERRQAEEKLREFAAALERSNRELQDFASIASHDLQEPLRKIQTFAEELEEVVSEGTEEDVRDVVGRMKRASGRMRTLINDLLNFSRVTTRAQPFATVNMREVCEEVLSDLDGLIKETGGSVEVGELGTIEADSLQMRQLIQNLISNALKFRRQGEPPVVRVRGQLLRGSANGAGKANGNGGPQNGGRLNGATKQLYRLTVEDNGIGFDEKYLDRIFTIFQRLHGRMEYEGTGIGLAICRKIANRHGGDITARSTPGKGSTFIVTLPAKQENGDRV